MAEFPFTIEAVNRFRPKAEIREVLKRTAAGKVDILIGTHRIRAEGRRVQGPGAGDHRRGTAVRRRGQGVAQDAPDDGGRADAFGHTDSAHLAHEPAGHPRYLEPRNAAAGSQGDRDARASGSIAETIKRAIHRELNRDGQIYFVHNRVYDIGTIADKIQSIVPEARIAIGHGQMARRRARANDAGFISRKFDILVATTIIESGWIFPTSTRSSSTRPTSTGWPTFTSFAAVSGGTSIVRMRISCSSRIGR